MKIESLSRRALLHTGAFATAAAVTAAPSRSRAAASVAAGASKYKVSVAAYSLDKQLDLKNPKLTLRDFVEKCAGWGADGIELTEYYFPKPITPEYIQGLKRLAIVNGLPVTGTPIGNVFTLPAGEKRDKEIASVKKWIDVSADLGSPAIRIFAGKAEGGDVAQARKWAIECIEACCEHAARRGVFLALENHGGIVGDADGMLAIVRAVKHDWFGVNLDTGNFVSDDPYAELERCAPYAVTCQVKVQVQNKAGKKTPTDYARIVKIMHKANYRGYLTLEYEAKDEDPMVGIPRALQQLRKAAAG